VFSRIRLVSTREDARAALCHSCLLTTPNPDGISLRDAEAITEENVFLIAASTPNWYSWAASSLLPMISASFRRIVQFDRVMSRWAVRIRQSRCVSRSAGSESGRAPN
jgi:hypothetical protein